MPQANKSHPPSGGPDRFDAVFRLAPIGIIMGGLDGRVQAANPAMCQMLGYDEDELVGRSILAFTAPDDAAATMAMLRRLTEPGADRAASLEKRYVHKQGHTVWGIANVHLHRDATGAPRFFLAHVQDVTERKRAEEVLRESEEKLRIAFENAPVGMGIVGPSGRFLNVNPALCRMFGYSRERLTAGTFKDITHPDDVERSNCWVRQIIAGDYREPELEKRYLHQDGHVVWGLVRAQWVRNDDGSARMSIVHITDITERKRAQEALLERERQLRQAHELARTGHWSIELPGGEIRWAESVFRLLELDPAGSPPSLELALSRVHPGDVAAVRETLRAAVEDQQPSDVVCRLLFPDGRIKHFRGICHPERDGDGRPLRVSGVFQDITIMCEAEAQRARLEEQLQRARRMEAIGYLAGGIAHDFNNLLTVIGGNASLALLDVDPASRLAVLLAEITQAVGSATQLTRQLLAFSRKQVIEPRVMNLNERIRSLTCMLRRLLGETLELETILDPELGQVRFDGSQAEQMLINLAVNARDAMPDGGKLTIRTANVDLEDTSGPDGGLVGPFVLLEVADTGAGMSEETRQRIFEPFFTTKEGGRGTGLGLAVVDGAVAQNQGHIEVASTLGHGSTFRIYLPRVQAPPPVSRKPRAPLDVSRTGRTVAPTGGQECIFFVEDDAAVRIMGERVLAREGYQVRAFANGADALAATRDGSRAVDLVVTDVVMPGMNGRVLADELRRLSPSLKVLFTSGYTRDVIGQHGVLEEGVQFLPKPYSFEDLARKVREVLG